MVVSARTLMWAPVFTIILAGALAAPQPAAATPIRVDWSADVTPRAGDEVGSGALSGTFGVFDVTQVGDAFLLPVDGSLTAQASGFTSGFPNTTFTFTYYNSPQTGLSFEFTSLDPIAGTLVGAGMWSSAIPCVITGNPPETCEVFLEDEFTLDDTASAVHSEDIDSKGPISYTFTVIPEPTTAMLLLLGLSGVAIARPRPIR
jgi:hypothetical protein